VQLVLLIGGAWNFTREMGVVGTALAWVPAILVTQLITVAFLPRVLPRPFAGMLSVTTGLLAATATVVALAIWLDSQIDGLAGLLVAGVAGTVLYIGLLSVADSKLDLGLGRSLLRVFPQLQRRR
jgi:hypothetical protein